jgi:hypothetical protein
MESSGGVNGALGTRTMSPNPETCSLMRIHLDVVTETPPLLLYEYLPVSLGRRVGRGRCKADAYVFEGLWVVLSLVKAWAGHARLQ